MSNANTVLAAAIAQGADKLSTEDCVVCLAYSYAGANSAQTQLNAAIAAGLDKLADEDVWRCVAFASAGGATAQTAIDEAIALFYDGFSNGDLLRCLASVLGLNDNAVLDSAIAAGFDRLSVRDNMLCFLYGLCTTNGVGTVTLEAGMIQAGFDTLSVRDIKMITLFFLNNVVPPPVGSFMLLESGGRILLEGGGMILLE
jgi:hypothetical protein